MVIMLQFSDKERLIKEFCTDTNSSKEIALKMLPEFTFIYDNDKIRLTEGDEWKAAWQRTPVLKHI
jgi:ribosome-binding factor A